MRVAWFRANPTSSTDIADATAPVVEALRTQGHVVDVITASTAHAFVVTQALQPYDVCVFEPRNHPPSDFVWAYLLQYPGLLILQDPTLHDSRARALERQGRRDDYAAEFAFNQHRHPPVDLGALAQGSWPMLRVALSASKATVVFDEDVAFDVRRDYPLAAVQTMPLCVPGSTDGPPFSTSIRQQGPCHVAVAGPLSSSIAHALRRAGDLGAIVTVVQTDHINPLASSVNVVLALDSLATYASGAAAIAGMAAGCAVVVLERGSTAAWPAWDPHTWRPRDPVATAAPIVVSIDSRDEEHSLVLALRELATNVVRRQQLGDAAHAWWRTHATPERNVSAWMSLLESVAAAPAPTVPADWPPHLDVDGTAQARAVADELGVVLDL
jgi:hypothetical protein